MHLLKETQDGIFGYGYNGSMVSMSNLVSSARSSSNRCNRSGNSLDSGLAACEYGGGLGIFGYGTRS